MLSGLPATDWVPPLLRQEHIIDFLRKLDNKFTADWIGQKYPTERIEAMNTVIKVIDRASSCQDVLSSECFAFDKDSFTHIIDAPIYGKYMANAL